MGETVAEEGARLESGDGAATAPGRPGPGTPELALHRRMFWAWFSLFMAAVIMALLIVLLSVRGGSAYGWVLIVVLGLFAFPTIRRLGNATPSLEVHPEGLLDRMTVDGSEVFIPWADIIDAEPAPFGVLRLRVRDPERYLDEVGPLRRLSLRSIQRTHGTPFVLPGDLRTADGEAVGREEMEDLITTRIDRRLREEIREGRVGPS